MSDVKLKVERKNEMYLFRTAVENIFINELLPVAPGEYVKVYLFGLMYAEQERTISREAIARTLRMTVGELDAAWKYWEDRGAVRLERQEGSDDYEIVFVSQIQALYGSRGAVRKADGTAAEPATPEQAAADKLRNIELKGVFDVYEAKTGRLVSRTEADKIRDALTIYGVTPDVYSYAIKYCAEREKTSVDYITAVAMRWTKDGCRTIADVKRLIDAESERSELYYRVFDELGFKRASTPGDRAMIDKWTDEWQFGLKDILDACRRTAGLRDPSLRYVDRVLENKRLEAGGVRTGTGSGEKPRESGPVSVRVLDSYYRYLQEQAAAEQQRRTEEVSRAVPQLRDLLAREESLRKGLLLTDFSEGAKARRKESRARLQDLNKRKIDILAENGYPGDYLETPYKCKLCRDTGVTDDGRYCTCRKERAQEAYTWNKNRQQQK
ncbi:MAG: DnaD domain protein [Mogibacterium sp.]|nr:DnaD domain protein [Mogibacterium sp.]